jgi:hypothetical protein
MQHLQKHAHLLCDQPASTVAPAVCTEWRGKCQLQHTVLTVQVIMGEGGVPAGLILPVALWADGQRWAFVWLQVWHSHVLDEQCNYLWYCFFYRLSS